MTSILLITQTEHTLLQSLRQSLQQSNRADFKPSLSAEEWPQLLTTADRHEVLSLLETTWDSDQLPKEQRMFVQAKTAKTIHKGIQLQALNARLTSLLAKEGITAITLKGCTVSRYYPTPEFRKTSDIDLFVANPEEAKKAVRILGDNGFKPSGAWHANHHFILSSDKNEVVELHTAWADDFKDKNLNQYMAKMQPESMHHCHLTDIQGFQVYAYETPWHAFYLMIHMLTHFVGSGFGLRNLCDWVVLWNHCDEVKAREDFLKMAVESGTDEFAAALTAICVKYLGLDRAKSPVPDEKHVDPETVEMLLRDILDAGEFGYSEAARMVGMDGDSWTAYVREFHHQMHINFPKAGRWIILWPVLWAATLVRFLRNNRKLHRAPLTEIMKKAGKRGRLVSRLAPHKKE